MRRRSKIQEAISKAAIDCFSRLGPDAPSMSDIAREASVSRATLYRQFPNRSALIQHVVTERVRYHIESLFRYFRSGVALEVALVEGSIMSLRAGRSDALLMAFIHSNSDRELEDFWAIGSPLGRVMRELWGPLISDARQRGRIRKGPSDSQIIEWIQNVHRLLVRVDAFSERDWKRILNHFLVPSIIAR